MEVGPAAETPGVEAYAAVLAEVAVGAYAGGILQEYALVVFLGDDVDHASDGVAPVERGGGAADNLHALDVVRIDQREVVLPAHIAVDALAIDEHEDVVVAEAIHLHMAAHVIVAKGKRGGEAGEDVFEVLPGKVTQHAPRDDLRLHRHTLQRMLRAGGGDDHLV